MPGCPGRRLGAPGVDCPGDMFSLALRGLLGAYTAVPPRRFFQGFFMTASPSSPGMDDVRQAAARLAGLAVRTPLIESPALNERLGARVLFKAEVLQRTGSFKFRGAYNKIASLSPQQRAGGIVTFSSGNHAQGVAAAAAMFGAKAVIAMPSDAPAMKLDNVRRMGAEIVLFDRANSIEEEPTTIF